MAFRVGSGVNGLSSLPYFMAAKMAFENVVKDWGCHNLAIAKLAKLD